MPKKALLSLLSTLFLAFIFSTLWGQSRDTYWYFGSNTNSIEFNKATLAPTLVDLPHTLGTGGGAVASDYLNGALLFYTDGVDIYAADDELLGTVSGSTTRNQAAVVCLNPADADTSQYFLFTVDNGGLIHKTVYDKNEYRNAVFPAPPDGDLLAGSINLTDPNLPSVPLSEGMVMIANQDRTGFWLITHENGTTNYNVTQIDDTGINTTTIALAGAPTDVANMSFSAANSQIALSPTSGAENITILDINITTGALAVSGIDMTPVANGAIYDTEWSSSGQYLYISGDIGGTQVLKRVDVTASPISDSTINTTGIVNSYGLQYGADTAIYHLYENGAGQFVLGRIEAPNITDKDQVLYNASPQGFNNVDFTGRQFPAFLPPYNLLNLDFTFTGTCANVPTYFFPDVTPDIGSIEWDFLGDGNYVPLIGGSFTYQNAGTYDVTMRVNLGGAMDSVTKSVTINDFELTINIDPQQQYWCPDDFGDRMDPATSIVTYTASVSGANSSGAIIRWSNQTAAEANATTTFVEPGTYYVVATDPNTGCEAYQEQQVFEYGAQNNYAFVWYFGDHAGLDFNPFFDTYDPDYQSIQPVDLGDPDFNGGNKMESPEGCAVYCDANGDILLYSDGQEVYNKAGTLLTDQLGGDETAAQSVLIVQNPADATQYYVFFTNEVPESNNYEFSYAIFDLKKLNGDGDLVRQGNVSTANPIITTLYNNSTERITGNANWVISHEYGNDIFRAYPINGQGIGAPVFSSAGEIHDRTATSGKSYMKLSADRIAVALSISTNENYIDLFDFDLTTGAITPYITLDFNPDTGQAYGVEFSPDNNKVYATLRNSGGGTKIVSWEIDTTTVQGQVTDQDYIRDSKIIIANEAGIDMGAMQQGPQGSIYIAKDGANTLASLDDPDNFADSAAYTLSTGDFPNVGSGGTSRLGLPNFVDFNGSTTPSPSLSVSNGCQNQSLVFTVLNPLPDANIESYVVQIYDDANNTVATSPTLDANNTSWTFTNTQSPGNYEAELFILNTCGLATTSDPRQPFVINPLPTIGTITPTPPSDCGINDGDVSIEFTSTGNLSYSISGPVSIPTKNITGPTTESIMDVFAPGFYTINVTQTYATGSCSNTFTFNMNNDPGYTITASEDQKADCNGENGVASFVVNGTPPASFTWELRSQSTNALVDNGTDANLVTTNPIDSGAYYFQLTDNNGCIVTDNVNITTPDQINLSIGNIPFSCDGEDIFIAINTDSQQTLTVNEFVQGGIGDPITNYEVVGVNDSIRISRPNNGNGTYEYVVVAPGDIDGPCTNAQLITVSFGSSDPSPYASAYSFCSFEVSDEKKYVFLDNNPAGFTSVAWYNDNDELITGNSESYAFIDSLDAFRVGVNGMVRAELTNVFGCVTTAEINIIEDCKARINAPNAFRPESAIPDNQVWKIFPFLVSSDEFEIFIYNRWGELIFQSSDLNFMKNTGWNGGYDNDPGRPLPGGTYAFKVQFKSTFDENPELQERRGGITLIR